LILLNSTLQLARIIQMLQFQLVDKESRDWDQMKSVSVVVA